ncbi:MAG: prepilin-type N-terminal cleavage/methylation domain-containing protein [Betaproteobacteria bacterium]|uniref:Prepilin-type N-terminal cleavage/methylation domain-containing protein n=1 Tax=Candidatus Proximibacter danicus TaxID=2954365 RepID=A0A9D7PR11_9PROT|nr:prepilin-type N-terminal cleavage/methylation domain-containing protein [Candidatus Proximibacter danicus]
MPYASTSSARGTRPIQPTRNQSHVLQGWVFALNGEACYATAVGAGIADLSDDFENFIFWSACGTPFDTITIYDEDSSEAFKSFRVGFTTGQKHYRTKDRSFRLRAGDAAMTRGRNRPRSKGFSLIELAIVLVIVALLTGDC